MQEEYIDAPHTTLETLAVRPPSGSPPPTRTNRFAIILVATALILAIPAGLVVGTLGDVVAVASPTPTPSGSAYATSATITFTRVTKAIAVPHTTLIAATDGSGQIRATELDVSIHHATSLPIDAPYVAKYQSYIVPDGCGDPQPAYDAAFQGVSYQLESRSPGGSIVFYGPGFSFDDGSFFCSPTARTASAQPFTYSEFIDGYGFHVYYLLIDAQSYQIAQLQKYIPAHEVLLTVQTCTGVPKTANASQTRVTITCPTTGIAGWDWPADALTALAQQLVGLTPSAAKQLLNTLPGIVPGSAQITLTSGALLPSDAGAMTLTANY